MSQPYTTTSTLLARHFLLLKLFLFISCFFLFENCYAQPVITINGPGTACVGVATSFSASINVSYGTVSWSVTNGTIVGPSNSTTVSAKINAGGGTLSVTFFTSGGGFVGNQSKVVNSTSTPTVSITAPSQICSHSPSTTFTATATGGGTISYQWYYNGSVVAGATSSTYTRSVTQDASVYCKATNSCGTSPNSNTHIVQITNSDTPDVTIIPSKLSFCTGEQLTLEASNQYLTASSTYVWKMAGNTISTSSTATVSVTTDPNLPNAYSPDDQITLDVANLSGNCLTRTTDSEIFSTAVSIAPPPSMPASAIDVSRCGPGQVNLSATPGANADKIRWYTASDVFIAENTGSYQPDISTTTQYKVSSYNSSNQCESSKSSLHGIIKAIPDAAASSATICSGATTNIPITNPNNVPGTVFNWTASTSNVSGASPGTGSPINQTLSTSGIQGTVTYTITPIANGCVGSSVPASVTVKPTPSVAAANQSLCSGGTTSIAIINPNNVAGTSFSWTSSGSNVTGATNGTGSAISQTLSSSNGTSNGTATYNITASYNGCSSSTIASVEVKPVPSITNAAAQLQKTIFSGTALNFTPSSSVVNSTFTWTSSTTGSVTGVSTSGTGSITDSPVNFSADATATYHITPVSNNCNGAVKDYTVAVLKLPVITSSIPFLSMGTSATLSVGTYESYTWLNSSNTVVGNGSALITNTAGTYRVTVARQGASASSAPFTLGTQLSAINMNFIITNMPLVKNLTDKNSVGNQPVELVRQTIVYFDGLGRAIQNVMTQGSPLKNDVVAPVKYDVVGREVRKYLPVTLGSDGKYKDNLLDAAGNYTGDVQNYYNNSNDNIADDSAPYAQTVFEASPLNRVLKQGSAGSAWQPDVTNSYESQDKTIKNAYETNAANEVLLWIYTYPTASFPLGLANATSVSTPTVANYHGANTLYKTKTHDEHNNEVIEYTDREGRVILKRVQAVTGAPPVNDTNYASTYYVYDDHGNLVIVVPPEAVARLATEYHHSGANDTSKNLFLSRWAFRYEYDTRKRMVQKQVPGAAPVYMVYDSRDRLVMTQDGNQRLLANKEWTFIKYDALNRPVLTGKYVNAGDRAAVQLEVNNFYSPIPLPAGKSWFESYIGLGGAMLGYDNKSFPNAPVEANYLTATYYDQHDTYVAPSGFTYAPESLVDPETLTQQEVAATINAVKLKGQVTGMRVRNLYTNQWMRTVNYYDAKYRLVQAISDHQKGTVKISNVVDFVGRVLLTRRTYVVNGVTTYIQENPDYDHMGRLKWVKHSLNGGTEIVLTKNAYNELGQLVDKKLHSTSISGTDAKQSVDYRYNIRGWLTRINDSNLTLEESDPKDYFGMNLAYNENFASGYTNISEKAYNGNISAIKWSANLGEGQVREMAYEFSYDPMNRMKAATHKQSAVLNSWASGQYDEDGLTYDLNGNILSLQRKGEGGLTMDNLVYNYGTGATASNKLLYVKDNTANATDKVKGFNDSNAGDVQDYTYDNNGNLTRDLNKGIGTTLSDTTNLITYNFLNLPETVTKGGNTIRYIYDATGRKLSQVTTFGTITKQVDYIGELQFENDALQFISHPEGRIVMADNKLLSLNNGETTGGVTASNATLALVTQNGNEKYIRATANGTVARTGMFPIGQIFSVEAGERYLIRVKGYRTGNSPAHLQIKGNATTDINWPGAKLPSGAASESWIEQIVTIPSGITTMQAGLVWNTVTNGEIMFLNEFEIVKLSAKPTPEYQYNLTDHLGNVRVTFSAAPPETEQTLATIETANEDVEASKYIYYDEAVKINSILFNHTNDGSSGGTIAVSGINISPSAMTLAVGQTGELTKVILPADATNQSVNWTSSNPSVATVSGGAVTGVASGTATITAASAANGSILQTSTVTVGGASGGLSPLIVLKLNENTGTTPANTGTLSSTFTRSTPTPAWSANVPASVGGASSLDFGTNHGNFVVESASVIDGLKNLTSFTITGWVNCKSSITGMGGNRIVSWINNGGDGVDLVYNSDGSLQVGIDGWPDFSPAISSVGKVPDNVSAPANNWIFFAVTYQSSNSQVQFYFGNNTADASLDVTRTYAAGAVGSNIARLAVGHFNSATRWPSTYDRMFKGLIDEIQIHDVALTPAQIVSVQRATTASATVAVTGLAVTPGAPTLKLGQTTSVQLATTVTPSNATNQNVTWSSNNPGVATVSISGMVTAVSAGTAIITATSVGSPGITAASTVTVTAASTTLSPLVALKFNENSGTAPVNTGSQSSTFTRTTPTPAWSTNVPATVGGASALDFGTTEGNFVVESAAEIDGLKNLTAFTVTGWVNCKSNTIGEGGNRIVSWINHGGDGVDVVYRSDGSLQVGIDGWPDGSPAYSSANKITTNASAPAGNWVFFAMTYQSSNSQVQFYFGNNTADASLDVTRTYAAGAVGSNIGRLAVGHFNSATRASWTYDRMFRGLIDEIQIHNTVLTPAEIVSVQRSTSGSTIPVTSLTVGPSAPVLTLGQTTTVQLATAISPSNATNQNVTWASNNPSVATVSSTGLVTAVAAGAATITATSVANSAASNSATVTVNAASGGSVAVTDLSISPATLTLTPGQTGQLTKTITPAGATNQNVGWISSNPSVATVNGTGLVTAVATGTATITATSIDGGFRKTSTVTVNASGGATYYSTRLAGTPTERYGLARSISVMPGDIITAEVYAKYLDPDDDNWSVALGNFIGAIASGTAPLGTVVDGGATGSLGNYSLPFVPTDHGSETGSAPKAYLNYIVFDRNMKPIPSQFGFDRISTSARESGGDEPHDRLAFDGPDQIVIKEPGYVYIYLSNESDDPVEVYFDDFKVVHTKGPIVSSQDYYPFGLTFNSYQRENSVDQNSLFQAKEIQSDLNLNLYDFEWRQYDATTGRTTTLDPHADFYWDLSPYSFLANNPFNTLDPIGMDTIPVAQVNMSTFDPEKDVVELDEVVITPGQDDESNSSSSSASSTGNSTGESTETQTEPSQNATTEKYDVVTQTLIEINKYNPLAALSDALYSYAYGTDRHGNPVSSTDATMTAAIGFVPGGKQGSTLAQAATNMHHSWPKFLGGDAKQKLTQMAATAHIELHQKLNQFLKSITKNGKSMAPSRSNKGIDIQRRFSPAEIEKALTDFYNGPGKEFGDAVNDFFNK